MSVFIDLSGYLFNINIRYIGVEKLGEKSYDLIGFIINILNR